MNERAFFDQPSQPSRPRTLYSVQSFRPSSIISMISLLLSWVPLINAKDTQSGWYFKDLKGGLYYVTSRASNITSQIGEQLSHNICDTALTNVTGEAKPYRFLTECCMQSSHVPGLPSVRIYSLNNTIPDQDVVNCLKSIFRVICDDYLSAAFSESNVGFFTLTIKLLFITSIIFLSIYYLLKYAFTDNRPAVPVSIFQAQIDQIKKSLNELLNHANQVTLDAISELLTEIQKFEEENSCPLSRVLMDKPVTVSSGVTYEEFWIKRHLQTSDICPIKRVKLRESAANLPGINAEKCRTIKEKISIYEKMQKEYKTKITEQRSTLLPDEAKSCKRRKI